MCKPTSSESCVTLAQYFEKGCRLARDVCGAEDLRGRSNKNIMGYGPLPYLSLVYFSIFFVIR